MICEPLLRPNKVIITSYNDNFSKPRKGSRKTWRISFFADQQKGLNPQLLRTCRQLYYEVGDLLYSPSALHLRAGSARGVQPLKQPLKKENVWRVELSRFGVTRWLDRLTINFIVEGHCHLVDLEHIKRMRQSLNQHLAAKHVIVTAQDLPHGIYNASADSLGSLTQAVRLWAEVPATEERRFRYDCSICGFGADWIKYKDGKWTDVSNAERTFYWDSMLLGRYGMVLEAANIAAAKDVTWIKDAE